MKISYEDYRNNPNNTLDFEILVEEPLSNRYRLVQKIHLEQSRAKPSHIKLAFKLVALHEDNTTTEETWREVSFTEDILPLLETIFQVTKTLNGLTHGVRDL